MTNKIDAIYDIHNHDIDVKRRHVYLHSHHYTNADEEGGIEYRMATQFIKNINFLNSLDRKNKILVHLQSPGGDWYHGMAIYDSITFSEAQVNILAYGEVSSMSSIVLQAAKKRILMPNCELMLHRGFLALEGVTSTVKSNALWNMKIDSKMLQIYAYRCVNGSFFKKRKYKIDDVVSFIDKKMKNFGDWHLGAEEAVDYGLADGIFGDKNYENLSNI